MSPARRTAWLIARGLNAGRTINWHTMTWQDQTAE